MKKAFTLIELLGVLILLAVIALITFPIIDKTLSNAKNEAYERQKDSILEAARLYVTENGNYSTEKEKLYFQTMMDAGFLKDGDILDPRDSSKEMPGCVIYNWDNSKNQYMFELDESCTPLTPVECFIYKNYEEGIEITGYDPNCGGMDVVLPKSIDGKDIISIGEYAFGSKKQIYNWDNDKIILIRNKKIANSQYNRYISSIDLSNAKSLKYIKEGAFSLNNLKQIIFSDNVTTIEDDAFFLNQLTSVTIPNSVTTIGDYAFEYNQLTNVTIPNSVTTIGSSAFSRNQLTSVIIPNSVTIIGDSAFSDNQLTSITIPNSVTEIGDSAFSSNQLTNVTLGDGIVYVGKDVFSNNPWYDNNIDEFMIVNNVLLKYDGTSYDIIIPNNVKVIAGNVFSSKKITNVTISNSVITIGNDAFYNNQLTNVIIPNSVTEIGSSAFSRNQLTNVTIPNSVTTIGYSAFSNNKLTSVIIPNSVQEIEPRTFYKSSSSNPNLTTIINQTGKAFDWGNIVNWESGYNFETGTVVNKYGNVEITKIV